MRPAPRQPNPGVRRPRPSDACRACLVFVLWVSGLLAGTWLTAHLGEYDVGSSDDHPGQRRRQAVGGGGLPMSGVTMVLDAGVGPSKKCHGGHFGFLMGSMRTV